MVASRELELPYYRGVTRQRGRGFGALAQVIGRTAVPFVKKFIVPAARRVGADLLEYAVPEMAEVISGKKNLKSAVTSVGKKTLRKQLGGGSKRTRRFIPTKSTNINSRSRRDFSQTFHAKHECTK